MKCCMAFIAGSLPLWVRPLVLDGGNIDVCAAVRGHSLLRPTPRTITSESSSPGPNGSNRARVTESRAAGSISSGQTLNGEIAAATFSANAGVIAARGGQATAVKPQNGAKN